MRINEIFLSIQGESRSAGLPTVFVRTTGCNLRCVYCDTTYAYYEGQQMSLDEVIARVQSYGVRRVCLTGGEPLIQPQAEVQAFFDRLQGYEVSVETSGSIFVGQWHLHPNQRWVVDMKVPSSGESGRMDLRNLEPTVLRAYDEVKFVVGDREDYEWSRALILEHGLQGRCGLLFSPIWGTLQPLELTNWLIADRLDARMQLQLHKLIWNPTARGV